MCDLVHNKNVWEVQGGGLQISMLPLSEEYRRGEQEGSGCQSPGEDGLTTQLPPSASPSVLSVMCGRPKEELVNTTMQRNVTRRQWEGL